MGQCSELPTSVQYASGCLCYHDHCGRGIALGLRIFPNKDIMLELVVYRHSGLRIFRSKEVILEFVLYWHSDAIKLAPVPNWHIDAIKHASGFKYPPATEIQPSPHTENNLSKLTQPVLDTQGTTHKSRAREKNLNRRTPNRHHNWMTAQEVCEKTRTRNMPK